MELWLSLSEIARNFGLVVGAAAVIFLAWQRVRVANAQALTQIRQTELARLAHVAELFTRPSGQLRDEKLEVRAGVIPRTDQARGIDLRRAFIRRANLSGADLVGANLSFADCANANFREADFRDALLEGTNLRGADLTGAKNLTREQIAKAFIDELTLLPEGLR